MIIHSTLFLFNKIPNLYCARLQNFIQLVQFLFNNFCCPFGQCINKVTLKEIMAPIVEVMWEDVLSSIDNLLMETEIQDSNSDLGFHEAALLLNRLEIAVSVLRAIVDMVLDLDRNIGQVLGQLCGLCTELEYKYIPILGSKNKPNETKLSFSLNCVLIN